MARPLHVRWLGRVRYGDALALQHGLHTHDPDHHLLLLEHPHTYTLGVRADLDHVLVDPATVGAELVRTDRGGAVTYHGPDQLVGYPLLHLEGKGAGTKPDTVAYVSAVEELVIDTLADLGLAADRLTGYPGVWVDAHGDAPRKICAIGVKVTGGRSMHGFALNVDPDLVMFDYIVPCGIADKAVTSLRREGIDAEMADVVDAVAARAVARWGGDGHDRADVVWRQAGERFDLGGGPVPGVPEPAPSSGVSLRLRGRLAEAGLAEGLGVGERKPEWMRTKVRMGDDYLQLQRTMRRLDLVTVCEEAGCPNIYECWSEGTATFMLCGKRCTRACGFCLVDTRHPEPLDPTEPDRVADAVERMGLRYAVLTTVARDDLTDGGASQFAATIDAIRRRTPGVAVECLISDCKGDPASLATVFDARPEVLNHNIETVARLQRAVRPSASYARSLAVLARAKDAGLATKTSIIVGMGETHGELVATLADLRGVGVDIVTMGQYLRPTARHLPVERWWTPDELTALKEAGEAMGIGHVEASPLTRSSYHARQAADRAAVAVAGSPV
ncbi:MAG: lipoyl synthase [Acidimicrobiales bacterium]